MPHINCIKRPYVINCEDKKCVTLAKGLNKISEDTLDSLKDTKFFNQLLEKGFLTVESVKKKVDEKKSDKKSDKE